LHRNMRLRSGGRPPGDTESGQDTFSVVAHPWAPGRPSLYLLSVTFVLCPGPTVALEGMGDPWA
jgi:hypothetical protein